MINNFRHMTDLKTNIVLDIGIASTLYELASDLRTKTNEGPRKTILNEICQKIAKLQDRLEEEFYTFK